MLMKRCQGHNHNYNLFLLEFPNIFHPSVDNLFFMDFQAGELNPSSYLQRIKDQLARIHHVLQQWPSGSLTLCTLHKSSSNYVAILPVFIAEDIHLSRLIDKEGISATEIPIDVASNIEVKCFNHQLYIQSHLSGIDYTYGWEFTIPEYHHLLGFLKKECAGIGIDNFDDGSLGYDISGRPIGLGNIDSILFIGTQAEFTKTIDSLPLKPTLLLFNRSSKHDTHIIDVSEIGVNLFRELLTDVYFRSRFLRYLLLGIAGGDPKLYSTLQKLFLELSQGISGDVSQNTCRDLLQKTFYSDLEQSEAYFEVSSYLRDIFDLDFFNGNDLENELNEVLNGKFFLGRLDTRHGGLTEFQQYTIFLYMFLKYRSTFRLVFSSHFLFADLHPQPLIYEILQYNSSFGLFLRCDAAPQDLYVKFDCFSYPSEIQEHLKEHGLDTLLRKSRIFLLHHRKISIIPDISSTPPVKDTSDAHRIEIEKPHEIIREENEPQIQQVATDTQYIQAGRLTLEGKTLFNEILAEDQRVLPLDTLKQLQYSDDYRMADLYRFITSLSLEQKVDSLNHLQFAVVCQFLGYPFDSSIYESMVYTIESLMIADLPESMETKEKALRPHTKEKSNTNKKNSGKRSKDKASTIPKPSKD